MPDDPLADFVDPSDPGFKLARGGIGGGGRGPIPGGSGGGGGGGGLLGSSVSNLSILGGGGGAQDAAALRTLLRKRLRGMLPGASMAPSYSTETAAGTRGPAATAGIADMLPGTGMFGFPGTSGAGAGTGASPTGGASEWFPEGANPSGDPTISLNPWSGTGWDQSRTLNRLYDLLNQFGGAGAFSPEGNKGLMDSVRSGALDTAEALRSRGDLVARNLGVDPSTASSYALQSDLNTQGGVADALNTASRGVLERQDAFGKSLLELLANANINDWMAQRGLDINSQLAKNTANAQGSGLGGFLGGVAGRAAGSWLSPGGLWGGRGN